jgi:4'-phosphopantetheinyl transferase
VAVDNPAPPPVRIWVATLTQADLSLRRWLDPRETGRFLSYAGQADQARFLLGAAMLRSAVGQQLGIRPEDVPVDRTCDSCGAWHGRPRVPGSTVQLSVSHAGLLVAVAMATAGPVGIDVERLRSSPAAVESWTHQEARFKAGSGEDLLVHSLPLPWPGHLMAVARSKAATVDVSISRQRLDLLEM